MTAISISELQERTGEWVRNAVTEGEIMVIDQGRPVAILKAYSAPKKNRFENREILPGYAEIMNKPIGGTDATRIVSEERKDRDF
jgi:antitoxin (DNA-binding transcriptional repressor) of toxin-antitoxin stability system